MASLTRFIERRLKLHVNADKSAVARPWERSFLGFTVRNDRAFRRCISAKAVTRFKDRVRTDVEEYCISEGWIRVQAGKSMDRKGQPLTLKLSGPVEAWFEDLGDDAPVAKV